LTQASIPYLHTFVHIQSVIGSYKRSVFSLDKMFRSALFLFFAPLVLSHTTFTTLYVDEVSEGDGTCVRMNRDASTANFPVEPLSSKDIVCGMTPTTLPTMFPK
jgi:hypothetical protein